MTKGKAEIIRELSQWPGVSYDFDEARHKHNRLNLSFNGRCRFVVYSKTASDHRAMMNQISDVRRICRDLGAQRKGQK